MIPVNTRDRSRSPVRRQASPHSKANNSEEPEDYEILHLQNLPKNWTHSAVRTLIRGYIPEPDIVKSRRLFIETVPNKNRSTGEYVLKHTEQETCRHLYNLLKGITYLGNPVEVRLEKESSFPQIKLPRSYRINKNLRWDSSTNKLTPERPFFVAGPHKFESTDYFQTYGLSTSFLDSLNVKPPLINRIYVGNLDPSVNELKLRQIFSHAGIVLSIVLIRKDNKSTNYARIEYDHPVEAIQIRRTRMRNNKNPDDKKISDMLMFSNLPSYVTSEALSQKMREVGQLKFAEATGNGQAVVRFVKLEDASRCKYLFDRSKVDGQTITVEYF